jgi:hypothetical protein
MRDARTIRLVPNPYFPVSPTGKKTLRTVLIVLGASLVVLLAACGIGGFFLFRSIDKATGPARDAAVAFVGDLEAGNVDAAYDLLCARAQQSFSRDAFAQGVARQPKLASHTVAGTSVVNNNGRVTATVSMSLTDVSGFTNQHAFPMVKEGAAWKVCGSPY